MCLSCFSCFKQFSEIEPRFQPKTHLIPLSEEQGWNGCFVSQRQFKFIEYNNEAEIAKSQGHSVPTWQWNKTMITVLCKKTTTKWFWFYNKAQIQLKSHTMHAEITKPNTTWWNYWSCIQASTARQCWFWSRQLNSPCDLRWTWSPTSKYEKLSETFPHAEN